MTLLLLTIVICATAVVLVTTAGWFLTTKARLTHEEKMFELREKAKFWAIEARSREHDVYNRALNEWIHQE